MDDLLKAVELYLERKRTLAPKEFGAKEHIEKLFKLPAGSISTALKKENLPLLINSPYGDTQSYLKKKLLSKETNHVTTKQ
jgi:hypothetical protein